MSESLVEKWHKGPQSESFATPRHLMARCADELDARDAEIRKLLGNMEHAKIYREGARQDHQLFPDTGDECLVCQIMALLGGQPEERR